MDPNNQPIQPPQPDYSFITGQPGQEPAPKKSNRKVIVLVISVVLLVLVVAIATLSGGSKKQQTSSTEPELTKSFIANVSKNTDEGYNSATAQMNAEIVEGVTNNVPLLQRLSTGVKLDQCVFTGVNESTVLYSCKTSTDKSVTLSIVTDPNSNLISGFKLTDGEVST